MSSLDLLLTCPSVLDPLLKKIIRYIRTEQGVSLKAQKKILLVRHRVNGKGGQGVVDEWPQKRLRRG